MNGWKQLPRKKRDKCEKTRPDTRLPKSRVGRGGDEIDQPNSWAGVVTPRPPVKAEKAKCYQPTDGPTDRPTDQPTERVVESRGRD